MLSIAPSRGICAHCKLSSSRRSRTVIHAVKKASSTTSTKNNRVSIAHPLDTDVLYPSPLEGAFWDREARSSPSTLPTTTILKEFKKYESPMHIIHVSAEMAPLAKVGGLGDVVTGLARACLARGHVVEIMLPFYAAIPESAVEGLKHVMDCDIPKARSQDGVLQHSSLRTSMFSGKIDGCDVLLVRPDWSASNLFQGDRIYGGSYNEIEAYLFFSRACLEFIKATGRRPDIIHAHEWQTAAVPMLFWEMGTFQNYPTRLALTIHNFGSPGECRQDEFAATGFAGEVFATVDKALDERTIGHNPERLCLLKGGIVYSTVVTTVSPSYAHETLHGGAAGWLQSTLARPDIAAKYCGVLNGVDTVSWDPATDTVLPAQFSASAPQGKAICKKYLQMGMGMDVDPNKPLVAVISRLVPQKGIHLIEHAVHRTLELGGQFIVLGSGHADGGLRGLADNQLRDNSDAQFKFLYSERLARLIFAAADMFLVPSMFEPCGLTQMMALRYGAIPIVRRTGGLADTVFDVDVNPSLGNGYVFEGIDGGAVNTALDRAIARYNDGQWTELQQKVMAESGCWGWDAAPVTQYLQLYKQARNG